MRLQFAVNDQEDNGHQNEEDDFRSVMRRDIAEPGSSCDGHDKVEGRHQNRETVVGIDFLRVVLDDPNPAVNFASLEQQRILAAGYDPQQSEQN